MYQKLLFPILEALSTDDAERAHTLAIRTIKVVQRVPFALRLIAYFCEANKNPRPAKVAGISFPNRVGLAAGFDKQGEMLRLLEALGFGFVEIGTVTPKPHIGNPRPRLARIPEQEALWNCMGFNSDGGILVADRLASLDSSVRIPIGGSLGKQKQTQPSSAANDYIKVLLQLSSFVDYYTVNISSPNTPGLRFLQGRAYLERLLCKIIEVEKAYAGNQNKARKPVFVKLAPDLSEEELGVSIEAIEHAGAHGIIVGNTTTQPPPGFTPHTFFLDDSGKPRGGYSGPYQFPRTLEMVKFVRTHTHLPIIACGGITKGADASRLYDAGASLLQILTGFVYQGPALIQELRHID